MLDGTNKFQQIRYITLPLLMPTILFVMIFSIIGSFKVFDRIYIMTRGGPANATIVVTYYLWDRAFAAFKMGYACGIGVVLFFIILILSLFQFKIFRLRT